MLNEDEVYRKLQQHLDSQAVAFPAAKSGAEIRLLKRLFTPDEARLAMHLGYKSRSLKQIYQTVKDSGMSLKAMENMLEKMMRNGLIELHEREGTRYYSNLPLIVGIYERQVKSITPELHEYFEAYMHDLNFVRPFLDTGMSQMRTIPVEKSIPFDRHITTYDDLTAIVTETNGPFAIHECICRKTASMKGNPCKKTSRIETCMSLDNWARIAVRTGMGREISKAEALEIIRKNEADGLVLQPSNTQKVEYICSCCGCCCGMLGLQKMLPRPVDYWSTTYYATIEPGDCTACGLCEERCQVNALKNDESLGSYNVNLDRCIGCGNCVASCTTGAITLVKKENAKAPPANSEDLFDTILAKRTKKQGSA